MYIEQLRYSAGRGWEDSGTSATTPDAQLVLAFGDRATLGAGRYLAALRERYPTASIVSCSSGGDVIGERVAGPGVVATVIRFDSSRIEAAQEPLAGADDSLDAGRRVAARLSPSGLRHVFVFAEGLAVNGSALARGMDEVLADGVTVTGGLAADGERFEHTMVGLDAIPAARCVVAVGIYGEALSIGTGSFGGWEPFGPDRVITRSTGNVLHELDGRPALDLYKELLGPLGYALPASGLMFPLKVREHVHAAGVVRTILGVNEADRSVTFAGDIPQGWSARLVRTNLDQLIEAAGVAASQSVDRHEDGEPSLVLAVSCIGRRLLLQQRVDEELREVRGIMGPAATIAGFYAYGELAPRNAAGRCELHNQTMTLTRISEGR